jgi:Tol biopolymer transport system component
MVDPMSGPVIPAAPSPPEASSRRWWLLGAIGVLITVVLVSFAMLRARGGDGSLIFELRVQSEQQNRETGGLYSLPMDGSEPVRTMQAVVSPPAFAPDGSKVAFSTGHSIQVSSPSGAPLQRLPVLPPDDPGSILDPRWLPDGQSIAYLTDTPGGLIAIGVVDLQTGATRLVPGSDGNWGGLDVATDGRFALTSLSKTAGGLWVLGPEGGEPAKLVNGAIELPDWSPDGRSIVYGIDRGGRSASQYDIGAVDVSDGRTTEVTSGQGWDSFPVWSPDEDWIAFASGRETPAGAVFPFGSTLFIVHPDGSDLHSVRPATGSTVAVPYAWLP